jgi:hypothetical protein
MSGRAYTLSSTQSENSRTVGEVTKPLFDVVITCVETSESISIVDIVSPYDRDDWCKTVFEHAKEGLDSEEGPSCCYVTASYAS